MYGRVALSWIEPLLHLLHRRLKLFGAAKATNHTLASRFEHPRDKMIRVPEGLSVPQSPLKPSILGGILLLNPSHQIAQLVLPDAVIQQQLDLLPLAHARAEILIYRMEVVEAKRGQFTIAERCGEEIAAWLAVRPETDAKALFVSQRGKGLGRRGLQRVVGKLGKEAGVEEATPHVLRHSFAKNLVDAGVSLEKVAELLGHSRLETTRIYTRPGRQDLEQAVESVALR